MWWAAVEKARGPPRVDSAFAMHVAAQMSPEYVTYGSLPMAGVYGFRITLTGQEVTWFQAGKNALIPSMRRSHTFIWRRRSFTAGVPGHPQRQP